MRSHSACFSLIDFSRAESALTASRDLRAVIHGRGTLAGTPLGFPGNHESSKHHHLTYVMDPRDEGSEKDSGLSYFLNLEASSLRSPFLSFLLPLSLSLSLTLRCSPICTIQSSEDAR